MPYTQHAYNGSTLNVLMRTPADPTAITATVRHVAAEISPDVPVAFTTMEATLARRVEEPTFRAFLFATFAGLAVCLAMAGVYGVMAYGVQQRSKEIGLRMALGASRGSVLRLILGQGLLLAAAGLVLGLTAAVAVTGLLANMLFQVKPVDAPVYLEVAGVLTLVTLAAGYLPSRRALAVNPVEVLKD